MIHDIWRRVRTRRDGENRTGPPVTIPVHETDCGWVVAYADRWPGSPRWQAPDEGWLTVEQAEARFAAGELLVVAEASACAGGSLTRSRWQVALERPGWARASFLDPTQSLVAAVDYTEMPDGRLFASRRVDHAYRGARRRRSPAESTRDTRADYAPDGSARFHVQERGGRGARSTVVEGLDVSGLWVAWPEFGDWDTLADPERGIVSPPP